MSVPGGFERSDNPLDLSMSDYQYPHTDGGHLSFNLSDFGDVEAENSHGEPRMQRQHDPQSQINSFETIGAQFGNGQTAQDYDNALHSSDPCDDGPHDGRELPSSFTTFTQRGRREPWHPDQGTDPHTMHLPLRTTLDPGEQRVQHNIIGQHGLAENEAFPNTSTPQSDMRPTAFGTASKSNDPHVVGAIGLVGTVHLLLRRNLSMITGDPTGGSAIGTASPFDMGILSFQKHMRGDFVNTLSDALSLVHLAWASALFFHHGKVTYPWSTLIRNMWLWGRTISDRSDRALYEDTVNQLSLSRLHRHDEDPDFGSRDDFALLAVKGDQYFRSSEVAKLCLKLIESKG